MLVIPEKPARPASRPIAAPPRAAAPADRLRAEQRARRTRALALARARFKAEGLRALWSPGDSLLNDPQQPLEVPGDAAPPARTGGGAPRIADSVIEVRPWSRQPAQPAEEDKLGVDSGAVAAPVPAAIAAAWEVVRASGKDGARLFAYAQRERLPVEFGPVAPGRQGEYRVRWIQQGERFVGRDRAVILISEDLREAGPQRLALILYHEYLHRLQDLSGQDLRGESHTREGMVRAVEFLRSQSQAGPGEPLDVPEPVQDSFGS